MLETPDVRPDAPQTPTPAPPPGALPLAARAARLVDRLQGLDLPLVVFAVCLLVYRRTLLNGLGFWDTAEFQAVPYLLGIAHPTGYPTYTLLGKLFCFWPQGTIAFRMNWMSAVCAAGAAGGLVWLARQLGARTETAVGGALFFAFSLAFWQTADRADPHTLHVAMIVALLGLTLHWYRSRRTGSLWGIALLAGLSLGNQMQTVMFLPAVAALIVLADPGLLARGKQLLGLFAAGFLGLSVYLYIPLRAAQNPALNYAHPTTWARFKYLVTGEQFRGDMIFLSPQAVLHFAENLVKLPASYGEYFTPWGAIALVGFSPLGFRSVWRKDWRVGLFMLVACAIPLFQACNYNNGDVRRYYFSATAILVVMAALGAQAVFSRWAELVRIHTTEWLGNAVSTLLAAAILASGIGLGFRNFHDADLSHDNAGYETSHRILDLMAPHAVLVPYWLFATGLWYACYVDHLRPDVTLLDDRQIEDEGFVSPMNVIRTFFPKRPVYLIRFDDNEIARIAARYELRVVASHLHPNGTGTMYQVVRERAGR